MRGARRLIAAVMALLFALSSSVAVLAIDSDGDGLRDGFEVKHGLTDPSLKDTDGDGVIDSAEDSDGDRLSELGEQRFGTHPGKRDTDGDGTPDSREDHDGDGRSNGQQQDQRRLPANLKPAIDGDFSYLPLRWTCQAENREAKPVVCRFGPLGGRRVALIGDSHAMMWTSPFRSVVVGNDWRFVTMIKKACPALIGLRPTNQYDLDDGVSCLKWQRNVVRKLNDNPPDLIVIASSDRFALVSGKGRIYPSSQRPALWKRAAERTLAALPASSEVLIMGDIPHNRGNPRGCLRDHRRDMSRCVSPKLSLAKRKIEVAIREAAAANGGRFRTLYGKICSYGPCPLVQGKKLIYRDKSHVTDVFARQLEPSIRDIVTEVLR